MYLKPRKSKVLAMIILSSILFFAGCSTSTEIQKDASGTDQSEADKKKNSNETTKGSVIKKEEDSYDLETLKNKALNFPLEILDSKIIVQDDSLKSLYPDLYSVTVKNNSDVDIKDYEVALLAWDDNGLPVKIISNLDLSDGSYRKILVASDVNLVPGATYGENGGLELDDGLTLETLQPVILSFTDFDDHKTENINAEPFLKAIEGKKLK